VLPLFIVEAQKEREGIHPWLVAPVIPLLRLLPLLLPLLLLLPLPATGYRLRWNRLSVPKEPHERFNYELRGVQSNITPVSLMHSMAHTGSSFSCRATSQRLSRALES
jgi:hypothetical protein